MSGYVPSFIKKDHYVLLDGEEMLVSDYHFVLPCGGGPHNSDELIVAVGGKEMAYDPGRIRPLPVKHTPEWLKKGAAVIFNLWGRKMETTVSQVFGMRAKDQMRTETWVSLKEVGIRGFAPVKFNGRNIRPNEKTL